MTRDSEEGADGQFRKRKTTAAAMKRIKERYILRGHSLENNNFAMWTLMTHERYAV